jgi:hypothetical protein
MRGRYFRDISIVRADNGDMTVPVPEENEVVIYRSFFKARLRFPLSRFVVEVLKIYEIFLHQITPEAIIRMGIFVWAMRSQGLEPSAKCFCSLHELSYETKPWGKEQYHNNFGCYSFVARSGSSCPVPTFRKRWPGDWMKEWFYVKNDLKAREDITEIIMRPIWSRFGLRKPKVEIDESTEGCQRAFDIVCSFIRTRDLVQEHVAYRIWSLIDNWDMPKETISNHSEGGLIRLKYTFRFCRRFETRGSLDRRVNCRRMPQPRWVGARRSAKGGRSRRETRVRGENPRPSCLPRAQVGCACSRGLQASTREGASGLTRASSRPSPRGQPS